MESTKISTFKDRLRQAMDLKGIRGTALANALHIHKSLIYRYLSGEVMPSQDRFDDIAKFFHVNHGWLMGYDIEMIDYSDIKALTTKLINTMEDSDVLDVYNYAKAKKMSKK